MKAARRRNSGTGEDENGWRRLSSVNLSRASGDAAVDAGATAAAASDLELEVKSLVAFGISAVALERFVEYGAVWCKVRT